MIKAIYNLTAYIYKTAVFLASFYNKKAKNRIDGLRHQKTILPSIISNLSTEIIFIHCASQGEHEQAKPILRWILTHTEYHILLSFYSPSGFNNYHPESEPRIKKLYLPFDTKRDMSSFLQIIKPKKFIIVKNEWWWNLIHGLNKHEIPSYLISATFRKNHYFIRYPFFFFSKGINTFQNIFVVNESSKKWLKGLYTKEIIISGDTRIDQVNYLKSKSSRIEIQTNLNTKSQKKTIVYGSVWPSDLASIETMISYYPTFNHLIFPHDLSKQNIKVLATKTPNANLISNVSEHQEGVSIVTAMGQLKHTYKLGTLAYIGGGFGVGVHNILEASVYNIPVLFGPNYHKSEEALLLIEEKCAFTFRIQEELEYLLGTLLEESHINKIETKLKSYFSPRISPTEIICQTIFN